MDDIEIEIGYFVLECRKPGAEKMAKDEINARLQNSCSSISQHISAVHIVDNMKGYVIVEAQTNGDYRHMFVERLVGRTFSTNKSMGNPMRYAKRIVGEMTKEEVVSCMGTKVKPNKGLEEGNLVEITKGAWAGETARITSIDGDVIIAELFDAPVPMRLQLKSTMIRRAN